MNADTTARALVAFAVILVVALIIWSNSTQTTECVGCVLA